MTSTQTARTRTARSGTDPAVLLDVVERLRITRLSRESAEAEVESRDGHSEPYALDVDPDWGAGCSCPSALYRSGPCKHEQALRLVLRALPGDLSPEFESEGS